MAAATVVFYPQVEYYLTVAVLLVFLVIDVIAFVNCLTQRADAFPVVGSLTKQAWLAILGAGILVTVLCSLYGRSGAFLGFAGVTAAAIYMLDVRPALRDASNGTGSW
jgi:Protein of unknown function (DUF2516)